jgi:hypothetical protein
MVLFELIRNYWGFIPLGILLFFVLRNFLSLPMEKQLEHLRRWLLWAVAQAELEMGSGLGRLKLVKVYDMFVSRFPWLAKHMTFNHFSVLADAALMELNNMNVTIDINENGMGYFKQVKDAGNGGESI